MTVLKNGVPEVTVEEATPEEGRELFERACQRELGVSAEQFIAAHEEGRYPESWPADAVQRVEFLLPFAG